MLKNKHISYDVNTEYQKYVYTYSSKSFCFIGLKNIRYTFIIDFESWQNLKSNRNNEISKTEAIIQQKHIGWCSYFKATTSSGFNSPKLDVTWQTIFFFYLFSLFLAVTRVSSSGILLSILPLGSFPRPGNHYPLKSSNHCFQQASPSRNSCSPISPICLIVTAQSLDQHSVF